MPIYSLMVNLKLLIFEYHFYFLSQCLQLSSSWDIAFTLCRELSIDSQRLWVSTLFLFPFNSFNFFSYSNIFFSKKDLLFWISDNLVLISEMFYCKLWSDWMLVKASSLLVIILSLREFCSGVMFRLSNILRGTSFSISTEEV